MKRCKLIYSHMNKIKDRLMSTEGVAPAENLISLFSDSTDRLLVKMEENGW